MNSNIVLVNEKEGTFIDDRWNFFLADNTIMMQDRPACSLHYHSFFEIEIPYAGKAAHVLNGTQYLAKPGEIYVLRYFDAHRYDCQPGDKIQIYNLIFNTAALPEEILFMLTRDSQNLICHLENQQWNALLADIQLLLEGQKRQNPDIIHIHMMRAVFTKVVLTILGNCLTNENPQNNHTGSTFQAALQQIQCHFREPITLKSIAKAVGLTPNYLGQLFLKHFNISFSEYLRKIRLEYGRNLLHFYDYSIGQVTQLSGFATDSHFISCFKAAYGMTPKQYKSSIQK